MPGDEGLRQRKTAANENVSATMKTEDEGGSRPTSSILGMIGRAFSLFFMLLCMFIALNVVTPLDPDLMFDGIKRPVGDYVPPPAPIRNVASVSDEVFYSNNVSCHAWLVLPKTALKSGDNLKPPVVVMSHGIAGTKDMGLYNYAVEFAEVGIASFLIDYRGFGLSDGEPRHFVSGPMHTADVEAAALSIASDDRVDGERLALWGTSLGGGHVVLAASRLGDKVRAVVSQAPSLDGKANLAFNLRNRGVKSTLRVVFAGVVDFLRHLAGLPSVYVALTGLPGSLSVMTIKQEELDQFHSKHPPNQTPPRPYMGGWENKLPPRFILQISSHRPLLSASKVSAPVLYIQPSWDSVVPTELVDKALKLKSHSRTRKIQIEGGHFELYREAFPAVAPEMVKFLEAELA